MKKNPYTFAYFVFVMLLTSCTYSSYIPLTVQEPLLKKKGEAQGTAFFGANHFEIQGAGAINAHLAIRGTIWKALDKRYSLDIMPGYYSCLKDRYCFGIYGGFMLGNTTGSKIFADSQFNPIGTEFINDVRYSGFCIQPGIGYRKKNFEISLSWRLSYVKCYRYDVQYWVYNPDETYSYELTSFYHNDHFNFWFFQPAINISGGLEHVKIFTSASYGGAINEKGSNPEYPHPFYPSILISTGIKVDLLPFAIFKNIKAGKDAKRKPE